MRASEKLSRFVKDALVAGNRPNEIRGAIATAGWTPSEVETAMESWSDIKFDPPIPRPTTLLSARDAFFYGLMFTALLITSWYTCALSFDLIDRWFPEVIGSQNYYSNNSIRWSASMLIVFTPLFFFMNHKASKASIADPAVKRSGIRRWFGYITLFLAAVALLGDLVFVIYAGLGGDLTTQVLAKAGGVGAIAGSILLYFQSAMKETPHVTE